MNAPILVTIVGMLLYALSIIAINTAMRHIDDEGRPADRNLMRTGVYMGGIGMLIAGIGSLVIVLQLMTHR